MRIWLDDLRPAPDGFIHVKNLAEFRDLIASNADEIEMMSFDHDLGDGEADGYQISKWFAENHLDRWPLEIKVHSANPPGAANIRAFDAFVRSRLLVSTGSMADSPNFVFVYREMRQCPHVSSRKP